MADEIKDDEIQIGEKKIGMGSVIKLNVKTLLVIVGLLYGGLSTVATIGYFNLKQEIELTKQETKKQVSESEEDVEKEMKETLQIVRSDIKGLIKEQGDLKGDIKVLLEKTRQINTTIESNSRIPDREHLPSLDD